MSILPHIIVLTFGVLSFLFLFWRRLREDYSGSLIFSAGFGIIASILAGYLLSFIFSNLLSESYFFNPHGLWYWGGFMGFLAGVKIMQAKMNLKVIETFEAATMGTSVWTFLIYVFGFLTTKNPSSAALSVGVLLLFSFFYFLEGKYRSLSWYKSGKIGFSGVTVLGLFFVLRMVITLSFDNGFSTIGRVDLVLSAVVVFLLAFSLYNLSET